MKIFAFAPYGVHPPRSAGHLAVHWPLRLYAERGHTVHLVTTGLRRFERRLPISFAREVLPGLTEHRLVKPWHLARQVLSGATRLPPLDLSDRLAEWMPARLAAELRTADFVQVESPWPFAYARAAFDGPVIFVAHNVETDLHGARLRDHGGAALLERARAIEGRAFREADAAFVCHEPERARIVELFGGGNYVVQPLGTHVSRIEPAGAEERAAARRELGIPQDALVALFAGSAHAPNVEAADFLEELAPRARTLGFTTVIAGSVRKQAASFDGGFATGPLPSLEPCFAAADVALNPMFAGSGMNLKVAECLAWALPVVSTDVGARGFRTGDDYGIRVVSGEDFPAALEGLTDVELRARLGHAGRAYATAELSWEALATARLEAAQRLEVSVRS